MFAGLLTLALLTIASSTELTRQVVPSDRKKLASTQPIKFIYINRLTSWWGNLSVPAALAVPGFTSNPLPYNYVCLTFWFCSGTSGFYSDSAGIWATIANNMGPNDYGKDTPSIQKTLKAKYAAAGVKFMVSAFGSTQNPTSGGFDPTQCGNALAKFVTDNLFDGVDLDWEDTPAFQKGDSSGENWLIDITKVLRKKLGPNAIITHAPQAPYFSKGLYPKGGYITVDQKVGSMIDFYIVQFYNQGVGTYDNAERLFNVSGDWAPYSSINEITSIARVPAKKVVLGKPATTSDGNNGWMSAADLNSAIKAAYAHNKWDTGIMFWQYTSDLNGLMCINSTKGVFMKAPLDKDAQEQ